MKMKYLFLALQFYTRIPTPAVKDYHPEDASKVMRCFSLVGWIVGLIYAAGFIVGQWLFGTGIGVVLCLVAGVMATGCFHEDGLADVADGFGGGSGRERILEIMKDSRIGSYGTIALVLLFALKISALNAILSDDRLCSHLDILLFFVTCHALARTTSGSMVFLSRYTRNDGTSKIKPVENASSGAEAAGLLLAGAVPAAIAIARVPMFASVLIPLVLLVILSKRYLEKKTGGYTGDCLGAIEQIAEVIILLSAVAILRFA